ncbi:MAG: lipid-A-disaccharide synthase [Alphaproteobacteria bacterium]|nr:lipid-A-disaccharide synthase [Alphaproteobacteria bacterium]
MFLVAAEASGDALGADLIDALRQEQPDVRLSGVGGGKMASRGVPSLVDTGGLAVLGLIDGVKAFGRVKQKVKEVADAIVRADPDAVVLIDSWGFMWRVARELKLRGLRARRIKLIGPQVWATRPGRARVLAEWCDHLLCIHAFEQPFYERWGLPTTVIGNPALGRVHQGDGARFRADHAVAAGQTVIGLLPGSRPSEIHRVAPVLVEAARELCRKDPQRLVVCVVAPSIEPELRALSSSWTFPYLLVIAEEDKSDAFAAMEVALACSGTVTTELAAQGAAIVVGYRLGWVTWAIARAFLMRARFITLLNVAANKEVAPEFVQTRFTASNLARAAERLLSDPEALASQRSDQRAALKKMAGPERPAASIAAETVLRLAAG